MPTIRQDSASPFHPGERKVQQRLGVRDIEIWARAVVRGYLPQQHRDFHTALPFLVAAARDAAGRPWATLLEGARGFVTSPDDRHLIINSMPVPGDALERAFQSGADIGLLGIELETRRRNRVNGRIADSGQGKLTFRVDQSFGNCPQYISERAWRRARDNTPGAALRGSSLTAAQKKWIASADTLFIASGYRGEGESATFGMDVSHRGGDRGFVQVNDDTTLTIPDYAGNNHFNTIGNLVLNPAAGCLFVDFQAGSLLQLTGAATIDWGSGEVAKFPGARRLIRFDIDEIVELPSAVALRWEHGAGSIRSLRLVEKITESADVVSFIFEARDGGPLAKFEPGQYLPIELALPGAGETARRTYSLSGSPNDPGYRISVKREPRGLASRFLHDILEPGDIIQSGAPAGEFSMPHDTRPLVLAGAGIGVTPLLSMLHAAAAENNGRPVWFIHGIRDGRHHPFADEVRQIVAGRPNLKSHIGYSRPRPEDMPGKTHGSHGRVDGALLAELAGDVDAHYVLCGPTGFMADIQSALKRRAVPSHRIHTETFGPSG